MSETRTPIMGQRHVYRGDVYEVLCHEVTERRQARPGLSGEELSYRYETQVICKTTPNLDGPKYQTGSRNSAILTFERLDQELRVSIGADRFVMPQDETLTVPENYGSW